MEREISISISFVYIMLYLLYPSFRQLNINNTLSLFFFFFDKIIYKFLKESFPRQTNTLIKPTLSQCFPGVLRTPKQVPFYVHLSNCFQHNPTLAHQLFDKMSQTKNLKFSLMPFLYAPMLYCRFSYAEFNACKKIHE